MRGPQGLKVCLNTLDENVFIGCLNTNFLWQYNQKPKIFLFFSKIKILKNIIASL